jgi:hypothetical protein
VYRILSQGCWERLELDIGKLIRPVLRGGVDGNAAPLPDAMRVTVMGQIAKGIATDELDIEKPLERMKWYVSIPSPKCMNLKGLLS